MQKDRKKVKLPASLKMKTNDMKTLKEVYNFLLKESVSGDTKSVSGEEIKNQADDKALQSFNSFGEFFGMLFSYIEEVSKTEKIHISEVRNISYIDVDDFDKWNFVTFGEKWIYPYFCIVKDFGERKRHAPGFGFRFILEPKRKLKITPFVTDGNYIIKGEEVISLIDGQLNMCHNSNMFNRNSENEYIPEVSNVLSLLFNYIINTYKNFQGTEKDIFDLFNNSHVKFNEYLNFLRLFYQNVKCIE